MYDPFSEFRERVEWYISSRGMHPTDFGKAAMRDPNFVFDLRNGRSPREKTMRRVMEFMERKQ